MARTVETGNWNASSHEPKVFGSGASAAMMSDFSGIAEADWIPILCTDDNIKSNTIIHIILRSLEYNTV